MHKLSLVLLAVLNFSLACAEADSKFAVIKEHGANLAKAVAGTCVIGGAALSGYIAGEELIKGQGFENSIPYLGILGTSVYTISKLAPYCAKLFMLKKAQLNENQEVYRERKKALAYILGGSALIGTSYSAIFKLCKEYFARDSHDYLEKSIFVALFASIGFTSYDLLPKIYKNIKAQIKPVAQITESKAQGQIA